MRRPLGLAGVVLALSAANAHAAAPDLTPGPDLYPKVAVEQNVAITMRDGVTLYAQIKRPADASGKPVAGRFPVLLTQTPYNKEILSNPSLGDVATLTGTPPLLVRHGYIGVVVDVRGTGNSGGAWDSFSPTEQRDALDIVGWIHHQPWDDGRLGLFGASYMGINQFLTAAQHPPGLKAMFPIIPGGDLYRDIVWHGGSVDASFIPFWLGLVTAFGYLPVDPLASGDPVTTLNVLLQHITKSSAFPLEALTSLTGSDLAFDGPFYDVRSPENVVGDVHVPTFITGGWWDLFQRGEPRLYQELKLAPGRKQLMMGPWYHVTAGDGLGAKDTPPRLDVLALAWFDRWVKGVRNHVEDFGPVTLYELGAKRWKTQDAYPGTVESHRLYLRENRTLSADKPAAAKTDTVLANPVNGVCNRGTLQWTAGLLDSSPCAEDERIYELSGLKYTTAPLKQDLHVIGPLALTLRASTTAHDTTWIATVTDVSPNGASNPLTSGWLMPSRRAVDRSRSQRTRAGDLIVPFHPFTRASLLPVTSGQTDTLNIEIFGTDAVIKAGHSLRVVLTHGDVPHLLATLPDTLRQVGAIDSVHIDPANPSFLTYGAAVPAAPRNCARRSHALRQRAWRGRVHVRVRCATKKR